MNKLNLVISGGGSRAVYALGVAQWLLEQKIEIAKISCVSGGSVVGAMLAQNYQPTEILKILQTTDFKKYIRLAFSKGFFSLDKFKPLLNEILDFKTINNSQKPLYIWAIELSSGKCNFFENELISDAIVASCSLYPIFKPYAIDGKFYIDGGFVNNLPAEPFLNDTIDILGINLNPRLDIQREKLNIKRVLYTMFYANIESRIHLCNVYYEPKAILAYSIFETGKFEEIFALGYSDATRYGLRGTISSELELLSS